ncbi:MAG: hypothetical protein AAGG72_06925 [Pseudomonadota bacterium]
MDKTRFLAAVEALQLGAVGCAVCAGASWALDVAPSKIALAPTISAALFVLGAALTAQHAYVQPVTFGRLLPQSKPEAYRDLAQSLALGVPAFLFANSLVAIVPYQWAWTGAALIFLAWMILRSVRPEAGVAPRSASLDVAEQSAEPVLITQAKGDREQRLAAYLTFFVPTVSTALLTLASPDLAAVFAGTAVICALIGIAMERFLWMVGWSVLRPVGDDPLADDTEPTATDQP